MKKLRFHMLFSLSFILFSLDTVANENFYGSWLEMGSKKRIDILDGFKPGIGAVLSLKENGDLEIGKWKSGEPIEMNVGWRGGKVYFISDDKFTWKNKTYIKQSAGSATELAISLKSDQNSFITKLIEYEWMTSLKNRSSIFKQTFSGDAGVVEFKKKGKLDELSSWSISSGVFKIGSTMLVEARISDKYLIGLNNSDRFIIFHSIKKAPVKIATNIKDERNKFFDEFLTDEWESKSMFELRKVHRFRPVYGELKGVQITLSKDKHVSNKVWEYSPATGAIKIGYTEYVGAMVVNNTLALVKKNGSQKFFNRVAGGKGKRFTLSDVSKIPLNEMSLDKLADILKGQFQKENYLYLFEFDDDKRKGYIHKWRSDDFRITGETFKVGSSKSSSLYTIEDVVIFDNDAMYKRDVSISRLKPKNKAEAQSDVMKQKQIFDQAMTKSYFVRITKQNGETVDVKLPISSFSEISAIQILSE